MAPGPPRNLLMVCRPRHATLPFLPHPHQRNFLWTYHQHSSLFSNPHHPYKDLFLWCCNGVSPIINPCVKTSKYCSLHHPNQRWPLRSSESTRRNFPHLGKPNRWENHAYTSGGSTQHAHISEGGDSWSQIYLGNSETWQSKIREGGLTASTCQDHQGEQVTNTHHQLLSHLVGWQWKRKHLFYDRKLTGKPSTVNILMRTTNPLIQHLLDQKS